jgi:apolipoprotein N-acyltransferase
MERLAGRIILLWGWRRALAAFAAGALLVLTQAPYDFFAAGFVSFTVLAWLLDGAATPAGSGYLRYLRPAFATGWWFGFGYFLAGLWWVGKAFLVEAESFAWALPFAVVGLPILLSFFYGFGTALARLFWVDGIGRVAALAFGFGVAEWLRTFVFTGFPWNAVGYAAMPVPLFMQSASIVGLIGMNALAVFVFAMPSLLAGQRHRHIGLVLAVALCALHAGFGYYRLMQPLPDTGKKLTARVVQPSVDMSIKWTAGEENRVFDSLMRASAEPPAAGKSKPQLILWPETSVPFLLTDRPDALAAIGALLTDGQMLVAGAVRSEGGGAQKSTLYYNSVVAIDAGGQIADAVDKVHLVPFGEYLPFAELLDRFGLQQIVAGPMTYAAGTARKALGLPGGTSAVPFICYEIIFPDLVAEDTTSGDVIINVTNDAWFGDTPGPYQHFRQAQVRAAESGLPLLRAANTGISGAIDARGRVIDALAINARGYFDVDIVGGARQSTSLYPAGMVGLGIVGFFGLLAALAAIARRFRSN